MTYGRAAQRRTDRVRELGRANLVRELGRTDLVREPEHAITRLSQAL